MLQRERRFSRNPDSFRAINIDTGEGVQTCFGVTIFLAGIVVSVLLEIFHNKTKW